MSAVTAKWALTRLGDICEFKYGKSLPETARAGGDISVFGSNGVVGAHNSALTEGPTIVIGRKGSHGEVNFSPASCWPIDTTYYVDRRATKADIRWLFHRLCGAGLNQMNRAAAVPGLNREDAYRVEILLPPLAEQHRITAILDQAETLRTQRRTALALLDSLTQSLFLDMFGDPVANPKGWEKYALQTICEAINDCPHSTPEWTESGMVCLRTSNLTAGDWDWRDTRYVSEDTFHERSKRGYLRPGDIVLSREGTVGIAAIVQTGMELCMGQRLVQLRPDAEVLAPGYLLRHLLYVLSPSRISQLMVGSTSQHLNVKELRALQIPLPPLPLQQTFATRIASIEALKATHRHALAALDALFASLQQRAFGGAL